MRAHSINKLNSGQPNQMRGDGGVSQAEYDEIMSRNKTVSSSAITRKFPHFFNF